MAGRNDHHDSPTRRPLVLIVEDDATIGTLLAHLLADAGFDPVLVTSGRDAIDLAVVREPVAVIVDLGLPDGDGVEVVRAIRATRPSSGTAIVVVTARSGVDDVSRALAAGADDYLSKPVRPQEFVARVQAHVQRRADLLAAGGRVRAISGAARAATAAGAHGVSRPGAGPDHERLHDAAIVEHTIATTAFAPQFQPIVRTATREVVGYEALTRFADGAPPDQRFAQAARAGRGHDLELATMGAAVSGARALPPHTWLSLNVSPGLLLSPDRVAPVVRDVGRPVFLELSEHDPVDQYDDVVAALASLQAHAPHVQLAVDDTGEGWASLRHVLSLHPSIAKLDRAWITDIDRDAHRQVMVGALQRFASETGCELVAQGVERHEELEVLVGLEVPMTQGYLTGKPAPASTFGTRQAS